MMDKQTVLRPQDLLIVLSIASTYNKRGLTYEQLGATVELSASQSHSSVGRARAARLLKAQQIERESVDFRALQQFLINGAKYVYPATLGPATRGIVTSHAAEPLRKVIVQADELPPVWPTPEGDVRGMAVVPLCPTAPSAAKRNPLLYELLALFDAIRIGASRERELATAYLAERLQ